MKYVTCCINSNALNEKIQENASRKPITNSLAIGPGSFFSVMLAQFWHVQPPMYKKKKNLGQK